RNYKWKVKVCCGRVPVVAVCVITTIMVRHHLNCQVFAFHWRVVYVRNV
ncbi:unnamed protein product, partial [Callosobruchus maculatus]